MVRGLLDNPADVPATDPRSRTKACENTNRDDRSCRLSRCSVDCGGQPRSSSPDHQGCRALGIETVAIHSTADVTSPTCVCRRSRHRPAPAASSYLNMDAILAAEQNDCQALHPGFGFSPRTLCLPPGCSSPPPGWARLLGPSPAWETRLKLPRHEAAASTIPGTNDPADVAEARRVAAEVGYRCFCHRRRRRA
jgi:hypothetical protein